MVLLNLVIKTCTFYPFHLLLNQSSRQGYERSKTERANFDHQRRNIDKYLNVLVGNTIIEIGYVELGPGLYGRGSPQILFHEQIVLPSRLRRLIWHPIKQIREQIVAKNITKHLIWRNAKSLWTIGTLGHLRGGIRTRTAGGTVGDSASGSRTGCRGPATASGAGSGLLVALDDIVQGHV